MKHFVWALLAALLFPSFVSDTSLAFSNSFFSVIFLCALTILLRAAGRQHAPVRRKRFSYALGFLLSLLTALGSALGNLGAVPYTDLGLIASVAVYTHIYAQGLSLFWNFLEKQERSVFLAAPGLPKTRIGRAAMRVYAALFRRPVLLFCVLLLCWAPCYLSTFPGNLVYDASYEYYQLETGFTRSFPLLHSAIITRLFSASEALTGSVNPGIAVYVIVQMLCIAALFTHMLTRFHSFRIHPAIVGTLTAYFALFPAIHLLVTCTTRDVLFAALLTWTVYLLYLLARDPQSFMARRRNLLLLAAALVFTLYARNNNSGPLVAVLLVAACALIVLCFGRRFIKNAVLFVASALVLFLGLDAALVALCQPLYESPPSSSMSILAQPIVRAYMMHGDTWPEEDRAEFESFFNLELLEYFPENADPAKGNLQVRYHNMREFLAFFIKIGLRHPGCYLDGVIATTRQLWFPDCLVNGYTVRETNPYYQKCYFYFGRYIEEIGSRMNWLPGVFRFYEHTAMQISFEKIPVLSMLFSIGFQFWLLLHALFYAAYRKRCYLLWPLGVLLVYTICCLFVPLVLLRYFCALFFCFPMIAVFTLQPSRETDSF